MQQKNNGAYEQYQAFRGGVRFDFATLAALFSAGNKKYVWNDSVKLMAVIWNLSHGRPTMPTLVDAIVTERDRENLNTLYQYAIQELPVTNPDCWKFRVLILPHGSAEPFAHFDATMVADRDVKTPWYVDGIDALSLKVYSIAEPGFTSGVSTADRFGSYTIFDNLTQTVELMEVGTLYLQCLEEQVEEFAGKDTADLFHKFRTYADCMLEMHDEYRCDVSYKQVDRELVHLQVAVYRNGHTCIVQFDEIIKKVK
jgi:hypothetical protein